MTKEEKDLLLKDLCSRLPYGVNCEGFYYEEPNYKIPYEHIETCKGHVDGIDHIGFDDREIYIIIEGIPCELPNVKIYLRPMSSMTKEEEKEYAKIVVKSQDCSYENNESATTIVNDWYLSKGFDVRGLIPMGLALEALEGMYKKRE